MTRSRKLSGKPTAKQNQQAIQELNNIQSEVIHAVQGDFARINGLIFGLLHQLNLLNEFECEHCGQPIVEPLLDVIPKMEECPKCKGKLNSAQTTIEDWDNGVTSSTEEE